MGFLAIEWLGNKVRILDQTKLPGEEVYLELDDYHDIAAAVVELKIRGAPAIGITVAYALALGAQNVQSTSKDNFLRELDNISKYLAASAPYRAIKSLGAITLPIDLLIFCPSIKKNT